MTIKLPELAFRNIFRNLRRSILSGVAIAVASMSIVILFALVEGMQSDMAKNLTSYYTGQVRVRNAEFAKYERYNPLHLSIDTNAVAAVAKEIPGVKSMTPRISFPASLYLNERNHGVLGIGADFATEAAFIDFASLLREGRLPAPGANEMLIGTALARDMKLAVGDKVTMLTSTAQRGTNAITLKIVGIAAFPVGAMNSKTIWMPLDRSQYLLRMDSQAQELLILTEKGFKEKTVASSLKQALLDKLGLDTETKAWTDLAELYNLLVMAKMVYYVIGMFFLLLGSTVIINTTMMVIFERMREIGTLSALGMQGKELTKLFLLEGAFISTVGAFIGTLIGFLIVLYFSKAGMDFTDVMSGIDMEISSVLYPKVNLLTTFLVWIYSIAVSTLATFIPSRRASKIQPVEALRYV